MSPLTFQLAEGVKFKEEKGRFYLLSETPIRFLLLNKNLYEVVKAVTSGTSIEKVWENKSDEKKKQIVTTIFNLVTKGYLTLKLHSAFKMPEDKVPFVSVIIPVRNRPEDVRDCLTSLLNLNYPKDNFEIIVVDDGSSDDTVNVVKSYHVKLICNAESKGPAFCRNIGETIANGEILAFLDSDCTVHPDWLKEIIPFFCLPGLGAVGGFVASFFSKSLIDRYEEACSSLNMGKRIIYDSNSASNFYVPSCNLFVRRNVFQVTGGFKQGMHLGEDVDLSWRIRNTGNALIYLPFGLVNHKHRNILKKMLKRRFEYGTSEADLYLHHQEKKKIFPVPLFAGLSAASVILAILLKIPLLFLMTIFFVIGDIHKKIKVTAGIKMFIPFSKIIVSSLRSIGSFYYYLSFHLIRYYLIFMVLWGFVFPPFWLICISALFIASVVDYCLKKPKMSYLPFLVFYILEHGFYQWGVIFGCVKQRYFKCYFPKLAVK
ncbi:MAG: mycofactocin biosynthesis glycosyltransferase MftF [Dehalobacterium sp.]